MAAGETELQMVQRHIREGADRIERQRVALARLRATGHPATKLAEALLVTLEAAQRQHEADLERLTRAG
jgi:hypothetical protein